MYHRKNSLPRAIRNQFFCCRKRNELPSHIRGKHQDRLLEMLRIRCLNHLYIIIIVRIIRVIHMTVQTTLLAGGRILGVVIVDWARPLLARGRGLNACARPYLARGRILQGSIFL